MKKWQIDLIPPVKEDWTEDKEKNPLIVETAGFIPLEVKFKRFEQAGLKSQFSATEFTSSDYREMYLGPNTEIYMTDDFEEITEKLALQEIVKQNIINSKLGDLSNERSEEEKSPSQIRDEKEVKTEINQLEK